MLITVLSNIHGYITQWFQRIVVQSQSLGCTIEYILHGIGSGVMGRVCTAYYEYAYAPPRYLYTQPSSRKFKVLQSCVTKKMNRTH